MARSARTSRSGSTRKPVTIDLEAEQVADVTEQTSTKGSERQAEPVALSELEPTDQVEEASSVSASSEPVDAGSNDPSPVSELSAAEEPSQNEDSTMPPPPPLGTGGGNRGFSTIGGGVVGAVIALLGAAGLQWAGILPSPGSQPEVQETVDLAPLEARITELQTELSALAQASDADNGAEAISATVEANTAAAVQAGAAIETLDGNIAVLSERLDGIDSALSAGSGGEAAALEALSGRLDAMETALSEIPEPVVDQSVEAIGELGGQLSALTDRLDAMDGQIVELGTRVTAAEEAAANASSDNAMARTIAAAGLKTAIDRGTPFMGELEAFASGGGDEQTVNALRDFAASGVPTAAQLVDDFQPVARSIITTGQGLDESATIADRLMTSARSLVQIRPVGEVEGDGVGAIVARMEARLKAGDVSGALAQWESLPEAAQEQSAQFADRLRARQSVDMLTSNVVQPPAADEAETSTATQ